MKRQDLRFGVAGALALVLSSSLYSYAQAQTAADGSSAQTAAPAATAPQTAQATETAAEPAGGLQEVTVTAQRRTQNIQDVPLAVTAFSSKDLTTQQVTATLDLGRVVPNMFSANNVGQGSANVYYIRGLGQTQSFSTFEPQVSTYVDDIYIGRQNANNFALFDISQLQVLNGPQGTLFGRNAAGGAVVVTLAKPSNEFSGFVEAGYGRYNRFFGRASVDIPISDQILTKTSTFGIADDGYVKDLTTGEKLNAVHNWGVREAVRLLPHGLDNVSWDISGDYANNDSANVPNTVSDNGNGDDRITYTGFSTQGGALSAINPLTGRPYLTGVKSTLGNGVDVQSFGFMSNIQAAFSAGTLNFITGMRGIHQNLAIDFGAAVGNNATANTLLGPIFLDTGSIGEYNLSQALNSRSYSQEIKWNGQIGDYINYTGGLFYLREISKDDFGQLIQLGPGGFVINDGDDYTQNNTTSKAVYLQADYKPIPDLTLTAGARYSEEVKDLAAARNNQPDDGEEFSLVGISGAGYKTRLKASEFTPHYAIDYQVTPDLMVFATVTRGFQGGGWNGLTNVSSGFNNFGPEIVWSYEAGEKYQTPDHKLRLNTTFFYEDIHGYQLLSVVGTSSNFSTQNSSDMQGYGVESEVTWKPIDPLTLDAKLGLINLYYNKPSKAVQDQIASCVSGPGNTGNGIVNPACVLASPGTQPPITVALSATYVADFDDFTLTPTVGLQWDAKHYVTTQNSYYSLQGAYYLLDAALTFQLHDAPWKITAECRNCTETNYGTTNLFGKYYNDPGRWDVKATYSFDVPNSPEPVAPAPAPPPAPAPAPPAPPAPAPEPQRAFQVFFDFDKSNITDAAASVIQQAAANVKAGNHTQITVTGHTDTVGSVGYNQKLSERRAAAVKAALIADGVSGDEISTKGVGKTGLLVPTPDGVREPQNRRAEIVEQ